MTAVLPDEGVVEPGAPGRDAVATAVPVALLASPAPFRLRAEMNGIAEAPGKVWFFELAAAVIDAGRCVQCGACIAACPTDSIGSSGAQLPELVKLCTGCGQCWDFCPRGGLAYETTWLEPDLPSGGLPPAVTAVPWRGGAVGASFAARVSPGRAPAARAQDGGVVSAVLVAALECGAIDGAVVAVADPEAPWRGVPALATTREQLLAAAGSFYNQTMALGALDADRIGLPDSARLAVVGTPCEVQALRALQAHRWRRGASRVDSVVLSIALMCTKSFDYAGLMLDELAAKRGLDLRAVTKVDIVKGRLVVEGPEGGVLVDEPVRAFHAAALKGCDECADFLGRAADISVGSVGSGAGWSSVLVRTKEGRAALDRLGDRLEVAALERPDALVRLDAHDRAGALAALRRRFDPAGPRFVDFAEHVDAYAGSDREVVWRGR